ncbi:hypothetical protein C5F63_14710 [Photobacterium damselae subsp. damselae]|uniref:hypothetical protein n=1 Tax=Photobacterium damselae TaxID=38293 RepID=UPI000D076DA7|nr:hypothetical protein [Photobacterium damselae]PSB85460.1 hypothetical protein C5F63_14710 [Photobacterium damselae subsp. damselae]
MNFNEIIQNVQQLDSPVIIGIEGASSSGKTTLGCNLSSYFDIEFVDLDSYVIRSDTPVPYTSQVNIEALKVKLAALVESNCTFIILGICLRDVLQMISITADIYIYVKKIATNTIWHYGVEIETYDSENLVEPHKSDMKYHLAVKPHMNSTLVYERVAD